MLETNYIVVFEAIVTHDVEANNAEEAERKARAFLDPDIDWDLKEVKIAS